MKCIPSTAYILSALCNSCFLRRSHIIDNDLPGEKRKHKMNRIHINTHLKNTHATATASTSVAAATTALCDGVCANDNRVRGMKTEVRTCGCQQVRHRQKKAIWCWWHLINTNNVRPAGVLSLFKFVAVVVDDNSTPAHSHAWFVHAAQPIPPRAPKLSRGKNKLGVEYMYGLLMA